LATDQSEQLRFLREAEEHAIKATAAKLQVEGDPRVSSRMDSPLSSPLAEHRDLDRPARQ
jgi:hypothetical protein